ncbi:hypothetical protein GGH94_003109 [Coemansia aciculifera]|uniref:BZIP domain-containing protein n=1 Tax=Coemansia aciculifera TaxID=417176 RepID=A0A9W8IK05_9FUNG|nr:hypothetical protein GGH94_003109 [Coemansia aciculifera]
MFNDAYASSSAGQQLPQKRQRNHHHHRRQDSSPERPLQFAKPNHGCDDNDISGGEDGDDFPDEHGVGGGVSLAPEDLARMSPTSRRRYQSRMSSARHRERQHKRIISTTEEVERLERHIKMLETSIDTLHRQPRPHHNAAWSSSRQSNDIGDAPSARSNPAAASSPRRQPIAGEMPGKHYRDDIAAQSSTRHHVTTTAEFGGKRYDHTSSSSSSRVVHIATTGLAAIYHNSDCGHTQTSPPPILDQLVHKSALNMVQSVTAAPWSGDTIAAVLSRPDASGQSPGFDFDRMLGLIFSLKSELTRLHQCALHMRGMKQELLLVVSTFSQCNPPVRLPLPLTLIPYQSLDFPHSKSEPLSLSSALSSDPGPYIHSGPSQLLIPSPPPPPLPWPQSTATSPSGPPDSASSALSRIAISSLVGTSDVAVYPKDTVPRHPAASAGRQPAQPLP